MTSPQRIRRGSVVIVDLDPTQGTEIRKRRPALVVSLDVFNSQRVVVVPLSSKKDREPYPHEVLVPKGEGGLDKDSLAQADQVRTLDIGARVVDVKGIVKQTTLDRVIAMIMVILGAWAPK